MRQHTDIKKLIITTKSDRIKDWILACIIGGGLAVLLVTQLSK